MTRGSQNLNGMTPVPKGGNSMAMHDEIRRERERLQKEIEQSEADKKKSEEMMREMQRTGVRTTCPVVKDPDASLHELIKEAKEHFIYNSPKITAELPDGITYMSSPHGDHRANANAFDAVIRAMEVDGEICYFFISFFQNGKIACGYSHSPLLSGPNAWECDAPISEIRRGIVQSVARMQMENTPVSPASDPSHPSEGCYIATAVYGSYDCSEVWILRRYRDNVLRNSFGGRLFIRIYYALSPRFAHHFGPGTIFYLYAKKYLDRKTEKLQKAGFSSLPYHDR